MSESTPTTWAVLDLIRWTATYFGSKGIESPRLDAELLLAHVLGMDRMGLYVNFDRPMSAGELADYRELVKARARREPVKYLTGECEFMSLALGVGPGVLIPRPETEHVVERAVELLRSQSMPSPALVWDVGTGSGCIAIALAEAVPAVTVVASDISIAALRMARANALRHGLADRILFVNAVFLDAHRQGAPADIVVSNPPYVAEPEWQSLAPEIVSHEPREALVAGHDGLSHIRRLFQDAPLHLRPGGRLLCEIGDGQSDAVREIAAAGGRYESLTFLRDLAGIERVADAQVTIGKGRAATD